MGFPGGASSKEHACQCRRCKRQEMRVRSLGREDSPGGGHGNPLQYSCLENPMGRGAWQSTVHRVAKSCTWLKQQAHKHIDFMDSHMLNYLQKSPLKFSTKYFQVAFLMLSFCKSILCHIHAGISHFNENLIKDALLSLGTSTFSTISNLWNIYQ